MSLMGIVNWLKKKIMGESKEESVEVKPEQECVTDEKKVKVDVEKLGKALEAAIEIEKNVKELTAIRERLKQLVWRRETNNDRRLRHRPMIRVRAYIKAERNYKRKRAKVGLPKEGKRWK